MKTYQEIMYEMIVCKIESGGSVNVWDHVLSESEIKTIFNHNNKTKKAKKYR